MGTRTLEMVMADSVPFTFIEVSAPFQFSEQTITQWAGHYGDYYKEKNKCGFSTDTFVSFNRGKIFISGFQLELLLFCSEVSVYKLTSFYFLSFLNQCLYYYKVVL